MQFKCKNLKFTENGGIINVSIINKFELSNLSAYWCDEKNTKHNINSKTIKSITKELIKDDDDAYTQICCSGNGFEWCFNCYNDFFTVQLHIYSARNKSVSASKICPFYVENCVAECGMQYMHNLIVPFDNDEKSPQWVGYYHKSISEKLPSYELGCMFDISNNDALVCASLDQNIWKTKVDINKNVRILSGNTDENTRDTAPHGIVTDESVSSPRVCVFAEKSLDDALEKFGEIYVKFNPPLNWPNSVPVGFCSWWANIEKENHNADNTEFDKKFSKASHFIDRIPYFKGGLNSYTILDSFWTALSKEKIREIATNIRKKDQFAGIYYTPFITWLTPHDLQKTVCDVFGDDLDLESYGLTTWYDVLLKDEKGGTLAPIDDGFALDVTHPAVIKRIETSIKMFIEFGYTFIRLDFLTPGALEGRHYNTKIQTGMQAYNYIMQYIVDLCKGNGVFLDLGISPSFPNGYGHSRKICCHTYQKFSHTEFMLKCLTYTYWQHNLLYKYNDPGNVNVRGDIKESKMQLISAGIGGSIMITTEEIKRIENDDELCDLFNNTRILAVLKLRLKFKPVYLPDDHSACHMFYFNDGIFIYLALFNFSDSPQTFNLNLRKLHISKFKYTDLSTGEKNACRGTISHTLQNFDCTILSFE